MNNDINNQEWEELIQLLTDAVRIPSINPPGNEFEMCEFVYHYMKSFNPDTYKISISEKRYTVISILRGESSENSIIFTGHMDVVPISEDERERWNTNPFSAKIMDDFLYGRGSADMKSGLCAAMYAMKRIANSSIPSKRDIILVATVDEEDLMLGSKAVTDHNILSNAREVVVCEPTNLECCTIGKGRTYGEIFLKGHTGHGSHFDPHANAILLANEMITHMTKTTFEKTAYGETFWQPLAIHAGVEPCVTPDKCLVKIDSRIAYGITTEDIWRSLQMILDEMKYDIPSFQYDINIFDRREPWINQDKNFLERIKTCFSECNIMYKDNIFQGTTDGTIFKKNHREVIIVGPGDLGCVHKENERVFLPDVYKAYKLYQTIMLT